MSGCKQCGEPLTGKISIWVNWNKPGTFCSEACAYADAAGSGVETLCAEEDLPDAGTTPPLIPGGWFNYIPATHKTNNCDCQYCKPTAPKKEPFHNPFQEFFGDDKRLGASQYRDE